MSADSAERRSLELTENPELPRKLLLVLTRGRYVHADIAIGEYGVIVSSAVAPVDECSMHLRSNGWRSLWVGDTYFMVTTEEQERISAEFGIAVEIDQPEAEAMKGGTETTAGAPEAHDIPEND